MNALTMVWKRMQMTGVSQVLTKRMMCLGSIIIFAYRRMVVFIFLYHLLSASHWDLPHQNHFRQLRSKELMQDPSLFPINPLIKTNIPTKFRNEWNIWYSWRRKELLRRENPHAKWIYTQKNHLETFYKYLKLNHSIKRTAGYLY